MDALRALYVLIPRPRFRKTSFHNLVIIINYLTIIFTLLQLADHACYGQSLITGRQLRAARVLIGWEQTELAKRSRVAIGTIRRMESFSGEIGSRTTTLSQVQAALEKAGLRFLYDGGPGVQLRLPASPSKSARKA